MAVGLEDLGFDREIHSAEARAWLFFLVPRGLLAVDQNIGVMDQALVAGANLDGFEPARAIHRGAENEIPIGVCAAGRKPVRPLGFDDDVGLAELPAFDELRLRGEIGRITFECALIDPSLNTGELFFGETQLVSKLWLARLGKPRRHDALLGDCDNLSGVRFCIRVGEEREWAGLAGPVARRARAIEDWRDVAIESYLRLGVHGRRSRLA